MIVWVQRLVRKFEVLNQFIQFLWERKLWWLIPMVFVLLLLGVVLVMTHGSALAPFIYTLF